MSAYAEITFVVTYSPGERAAYDIAEVAVVYVKYVFESDVEISAVYEQRYAFVEYSAQLHILCLFYIYAIHRYTCLCIPLLRRPYGVESVPICRDRTANIRIFRLKIIKRV